MMRGAGMRYLPSLLSAADRLFGGDGADAVGMREGDTRLPGRRPWLRGRPSLPLTLWLALGCWVGIAAAYSALEGRDAHTCSAVIAAGLALLAALGIGAWRRSRAGAAAVLVAGLALGLVCAGAAAFGVQDAARQLTGADAAGETVIELVQDGQPGRFGERVRGRVSLPSGGTARVQVSLADAPALMAGARIAVRVNWSAPDAASADSLWRAGICATARAASAELRPDAGPAASLRALRGRALEALASLDTPAAGRHDGVSFLQAVLLGWRAGLFDSGWYAAAQTDGLAHMVAVSGAHLAIVCGLALALLKRLRASRAVQLGVQAVLVTAFLVLTGVAVSAVRAAFMTVIGLSAFTARRRSYALGALSFAVVVMLALDPLAALSVSFLLSAGSTLGIVLFARPTAEALRVLLRRQRAGTVVQALALCLAAQLPTGPVAAAAFGRVSLIAPLANVAAGPLFTVVCGLGLPLAVLAGLGLPVQPVLGVLAQACQVLCAALQAAAGLPGAAVPAYLDPAVAGLLALGVPAVLWALWPRPRVRTVLGGGAVLVLAVALLLAVPAVRGDQVVMLDVGQGDAFLLRSGGHAVLIDTGNHDDLLLQGLARQGIVHLDAVALTHADDDHCGSLSALAGTVRVDRVLFARDMLTCPADKARQVVSQAAQIAGSTDRLAGLSVGQQVTFGNFRLTVVGPDAFTEEGGNADSLTLLLQADDDGDGITDWTGLFCGDAEREQIAAYERAGRIGKVDLYKVGHHGSREAVDAATAAALGARVCLVSVGAHNRYGHPVAATLDALRQAGGTIWRTDEQGDVTCTLTAEALQVNAQRPAA